MTAAILLALAAAVLVGSPPERDLRRLRVEAPPGRRRLHLPVVLACVVAAAALLLMGPRVAGWTLAVAVVGATAVWVAGGARRERRRLRARADTARAARTLALLLRAGQIPTRALQEAASDCPVLAPAAATGRLGGDVAPVLQETGRQDGRSGLARVAAAWRVSESTGAPVADLLAQVAETLRQERHLASVVAAELASARASGRIMASLPFVALGLGTLVGANPLAFLFGSRLGEVALLTGVLLAAGGVVWTERIARVDAVHGRRPR